MVVQTDIKEINTWHNESCAMISTENSFHNMVMQLDYYKNGLFMPHNSKVTYLLQETS